MEMLALAPKSNRIQTAPEYLRVNLSKPLHVDDLAKAVHLSIRQFGRIFLSETGEFPAKALERLRLEAARDMIERRRYSLETIASEVGIRDGRDIREVFVRAFGTAPQSLRREARSLPADENLVNG
ncbi:helix-turn-helix domain-containing protein [Paraburkholderia sp. XV]|jgi:transcriptional regulator GlxA family with amidase domain|uniref:helix-turn-helix domain-containing protein n=1 Tax=Paraburkholderia sp. XV TaxID=2831520 RepID=UPI003990D151